MKKLNINKACDLSSISVLPPHSRRSNAVSSGVDCSGRGKIHRAQLRSQSQQPFSQGTSLSQLSQGSVDEVLTNEQRFESQERDSSTKRLSCLASISSSRDESQMQLSRSYNNVMWRTNAALAPDQRSHVSGELGQRIGLVESSLNRLGRILETIQSDVMQLNKVAKEISLEMEGIQKKVFLQDNNMQIMLKEEEDIKVILDGILKSVPDQMRKEAELADQRKLHMISSAISSLPARIEASLQKLQNEICGIFSKEIEKRSCIAAGSQRRQMSTSQIARGQPVEVPVQKTEANFTKLLKPESFPFRKVNHSMEPKKEEALLRGKGNDFSVTIESDAETEGGFACLLKNKGTDWKNGLSKEARVESMRILKKARRERKLDSCIVLD